MAVTRLKVTKGSDSVILSVGVGKDNDWRLETPSDWFMSAQGQWGRIYSTGGGSSWLELYQSALAFKVLVLNKDFPFTQGETFTGALHAKPRGFFMGRLSSLFSGAEDVQIEVLSFPSDLYQPKKFKIRLELALSASMGPWALSAGVDAMYFHVAEENKEYGAIYAYVGVGAGVSLPVADMANKVGAYFASPAAKAVKGTLQMSPLVRPGPTGRALAQAIGEELVPMPGGGCAGAWNPCTGYNWMTVEDFTGPAGFASIHAITQSLNDFWVNANGSRMEFPSFDTGTTIAIPGFNVTTGQLLFVKRI